MNANVIIIDFFPVEFPSNTAENVLPFQYRFIIIFCEDVFVLVY